MELFWTQQATNYPLQEAMNLQEKSRIGLDILKANYKDSFACLWNNPNATPQEILDVYWVNAAQLFITSRDIAIFINSLDPTWEPPVSPNEFTINPDGTVTVQNEDN